MSICNKKNEIKSCSQHANLFGTGGQMFSINKVKLSKKEKKKYGDKRKTKR